MMSARVIAKDSQPLTPNKRASSIAVLMVLGLWGRMSPDERYAFTEREEVWDTDTGRELKAIIMRTIQ